MLAGIRNNKDEKVYDAAEVKNVHRNHCMKFLGGVNMQPHSCGIEDNTSENPVKRFSISDVRNVTENLKNGKAPGIDGIDAKMLKYGGEYITHKLCELIHLCIEIVKVPDDWKRPIVVPIHK